MKPQVVKGVRRLNVFVRLLLVAAILAITACSAQTANVNSTNATGETASNGFPIGCTEELSPEQAAAYRVPQANDKYKIALMQVSLAGYYYEGIAYGAFDAAEKAGVELKMFAASGYASPEQQLQQVNDVLQQDFDAILLAPSDPHASVPAVELAKEHGIPVINFSTAVASDYAYKVLQSDYELGMTAADELAEILGEKGGKGIVIGGPADATWSQDRTEGFKNRINEKYPQIEIFSVENQMVNPAEGLQSFENATQRAPDIDWVYSVHSYILSAASLPEQYRGKLVYVTKGLEPDSMEYLEKGWITSIHGIVPVLTGKMAVGKAIEVLNGETPAQVTCLPAPLYTKDNIDMNIANALELIPEGWRRPW